MQNKITIGKTVLNLIMISISCIYIVPIILMLSISFSSEQSIMDYGYQLIPKTWSLEAYRQALANPYQILNAYKVTTIYTVLGTLLSVIIQTLTAYPLSRASYNKKGAVTVFLMITMFFSGGLVPSYILNTQYLRLGNTFWIYIFPSLISAWNVILFKTYFKGLPESLIEAAKLDGAGEFLVYRKIIMPLSTPIIACIAFTTALGKWNDWNTSLIYIRNSELYSLQYLLQRIINESDYIQKMQGTAAATLVGEVLPSETLKYAIAILAAGPMMVIFPFFQKYFAKGLVVGSVKG